MDEAQKRYPVSTKLLEGITVTLHPNNKTYLVFLDKSVKVHIGDNKYIWVKKGFLDWYPEYKEPVKNLKYYESKYNGCFYQVMKTTHPNLYYQLILQQIADDLNGDWGDKNSNNKYCIYYIGSFRIIAHNTVNSGSVYFKSIEFAKQAINIISENKLKIILNIK